MPPDPARLLGTILPPGLRYAEFGIPRRVSWLGAGRPAWITQRRWRDQAIGRRCAARALEALGADRLNVGRGSSGEPVWPGGVVGSITHCAGYGAAAVGWQRQHPALGIDAEVHASLPPEVVRLVASPAECEALRRLPDGLHWDRLLFSAKESIYKAWFPLTRTWLGFDQVRLTIDPAGRFAAHSPLAPALGFMHGRFVVTSELILTCCWLGPDQ